MLRVFVQLLSGYLYLLRASPSLSTYTRVSEESNRSCSIYIYLPSLRHRPDLPSYPCSGGISELQCIYGCSYPASSESLYCIHLMQGVVVCFRAGRILNFLATSYIYGLRGRDVFCVTWLRFDGIGWDRGGGWVDETEVLRRFGSHKEVEN